MKRALMIGAAVVAFYPLGSFDDRTIVDQPRQAPRLELLSSSVTVGSRSAGFGGSAAVRIRFCARGGPKAMLRIRESARHGRRVLTRVFTEPLGVDVTRVRRFSCVSRFLVRWLVPTRLLTGREYSVGVRLRDGAGKLSREVGFVFRP